MIKNALSSAQEEKQRETRRLGAKEAWLLRQWRMREKWERDKEEFICN